MGVPLGGWPAGAQAMNQTYLDVARLLTQVRLIAAEGERPMSITWGLQVALPMRWFREFCVLRGV